MKISDDLAFQLLYKWDRRVDLEGFKLYNVPKAVTLYDYINFIRQYVSDNTKRITFVYSKDVGGDHLKDNVHYIESADINAEYGFCIEQNDKLNFIPIFMFMRLKTDLNTVTRYGVTATF